MIYHIFLLFCSIDGTHSDGLGRLCNDEHRRPNAKMKKVVNNNQVSLCLFALRDINIGDEIRYDYGPDDGKMFWRHRQNTVDVSQYHQDVEVVVPTVSNRQDVEDVDIPTVSQYRLSLIHI